MTVIREGFTVQCNGNKWTLQSLILSFLWKVRKCPLTAHISAPLSWEQTQVLVYYVKVHKRGKHNVNTMNYTQEKCEKNVYINISLSVFTFTIQSNSSLLKI